MKYMSWKERRDIRDTRCTPDVLALFGHIAWLYEVIWLYQKRNRELSKLLNDLKTKNDSSL